MTVTVTRIDGHLAAAWPGAAGFHIAADPRLGLIVVTCPSCGERTRRCLAEADDFEIRHRPGCRHERIIRRLVAQHPERFGERPSDLRFHLGDSVLLVVRDSMPLQGPEDLYHAAEVTRGKRSRASANRRRRRATGRRRRKRR